MSPPDFSDPESKLKLRLARPPRAASGLARFYFMAMKAFLGFCALSLIPIGYFEIQDRGFGWGLVGEAAVMLGGIAIMFAIVELLARFWRWMDKHL